MVAVVVVCQEVVNITVYTQIIDMLSESILQGVNSPEEVITGRRAR